ncbi:MAG: UvrB/UvrC motif-containing protein [Planctomycetes bacterium]|nr:UvrB/UvrC motif-containing protein [Planctomycetota bacterium]
MMLCQNCQKKNATVHLTEISNQNVQKEIHLCDDCAHKQGLPYKAQFSIAEILSGLIEPLMGKAIGEMANLKCQNCGISYVDFKRQARFGCADDYEVFKEGIVPLLERIHGATQHHGKIPSQVNQELLHERKLKDLQRELNQLIRTEEFEKAAEVRDKIKKLKDKATKPNNSKRKK